MIQNNSLIEIAIELMEKKRKPHTILSIAKDVFEMKGMDYEENPELLSQFQIDFMLCGCFMCCGEDKKGNKLWDLKERQHHDLLDKENVYLDDLYEDDEEVKKNELKEEDYNYANKDNKDFDLEYSSDNNEDEDDDDDDEDEEKDDIEEELLLNDMYDDDELEEDSYDDKDE